MARIDDYKNARELAKTQLRDRDPGTVAREAGARLEVDGGGNGLLLLPFLGKEVSVSWPDLRLSFPGQEDEVPIQQQVLVLHYLKGVSRSRVAHAWISYQEIPDGKFYLDAFLRRARNPMVQTFGERPELLVELAREVYNGQPSDQGDHSVVIPALPRVPVALILWEGDEEFPPEGNILFDRSISEIFSAEDIAWLAGMIIYPLMGMAGKR